MSTRWFCSVLFCSYAIRRCSFASSQFSQWSLANERRAPSLLPLLLLPFPRCWSSSGAGLSVRQGVKLLMPDCASREDEREERKKGSEVRTGPVISEKAFRATRSIGSFSSSSFSRWSASHVLSLFFFRGEPVQGSRSLKGNERGGDETIVVGKFRGPTRSSGRIENRSFSIDDHLLRPSSPSSRSPRSLSLSSSLLSSSDLFLLFPCSSSFAADKTKRSETKVGRV